MPPPASASGRRRHQHPAPPRRRSACGGRRVPTRGVGHRVVLGGRCCAGFAVARSPRCVRRSRPVEPTALARFTRLAARRRVGLARVDRLAQVIDQLAGIRCRHPVGRASCCPRGCPDTRRRGSTSSPLGGSSGRAMGRSRAATGWVSLHLAATAPLTLPGAQRRETELHATSWGCSPGAVRSSSATRWCAHEHRRQAAARGPVGAGLGGPDHQRLVHRAARPPRRAGQDASPAHSLVPRTFPRRRPVRAARRGWPLVAAAAGRTRPHDPGEGDGRAAARTARCGHSRRGRE
jgi:hypothetical protein